jgi:hypothetical protein
LASRSTKIETQFNGSCDLGEKESE